MTPFIERTNFTTDIDQLNVDLDLIATEKTKWEPDNQIGVRHRAGSADQWKCGTGWIYDPVKKVAIAEESDFKFWNDGTPQRLIDDLENIAASENFLWGRVRFMRLMPKQGLTMHVDKGFRYHLVLKTNDSAIFGECFKDSAIRATCYHIPADGYWYKIDTSREHFVFNGGYTPRIHLVACSI